MSGPTCGTCPAPAAWRFTDATDEWLQQYACATHGDEMDEALRERHPALVRAPWPTPARNVPQTAAERPITREESHPWLIMTSPWPARS